MFLGSTTISKMEFLKCLACYSIEVNKMLSLKDIAPGAENTINTQFIVLEKGRIASEGRAQNKACLVLAADETASVHFQLWNEECDAFQPGDIVRLTNGIFAYDRGKHFVLRAGRRGKVEKVGEFTMAFVESPNMSEIVWVPDPNNPKKYMQESVISPVSLIFPPMV
ncbi:SOSS complex subunit B [Tanacetum coccineum]